MPSLYLYSCFVGYNAGKLTRLDASSVWTTVTNTRGKFLLIYFLPHVNWSLIKFYLYILMTIWLLHCTKSELKLVEHFGKCHWVPHQLNSGTIRVNLELEPFSLSLFFSFHFCRPDGLSESVTLNDNDNIGHTFCLSSKALIQRLK